MSKGTVFWLVDLIDDIRTMFLTNIDTLRCSHRHLSKKATHSSGVVNTPSSEVVTPLPPLTESPPDLPPVRYATPRTEEDSMTRVTVLENGLRVASERRFGQFFTAGVILDSGSRYETETITGMSHLLEKVAFGGTQEYRNKQNLMKVLEEQGAICDCQYSRDTFIYATSANIKGFDTIMETLGEVVIRPLVTANEVDVAQQTVQFELQNLAMRPEQETFLMDMIHAAAFGNQNLGRPKVCPIDKANLLDRHTVMSYLLKRYVPENMVIAGVGMEHEALVEQVQEHFINRKSKWFHLKDNGDAPTDHSTAQYIGGIKMEDCEVPVYPGSDLPELTHVVLALEGCSHQDSDFIAMCVLNMMMGGGGSFSAGGPGKGMYTRLYTNVLNRHHWMFNATAYNHAYADTGLFCIHGSSPPGRIGDTVEVLVKEMVAMAGECGLTELQRAKNQLVSMLLMNLEARPVVFEDIGRQVLATGSRKSPKYFIDAINSITKEDILRVGQRLISSTPSVAARGKLGKMPTYKQIQEWFSQSPKRLSLFR